MYKSLKDFTDEEIIDLFLSGLKEIRGTPNQYGEIHVTVSGGKVKFITVEKPIERGKMDQNIAQTVYNTLTEYTDEISKNVVLLDSLDEKIKSKRYSDETLKKEIYPKREELITNIKRLRKVAIDHSNYLVSEYKKDAAKLNDLNPDDLTDDMKLLQAGINLNKNDIENLLQRNKNNRTMTQIILRYADKNKIQVNTEYIGGQREEEIANALSGILYYYEKWMDKPKAKDMLNKFFKDLL